MAAPTRLNVTLDAERAAKLAMLAERTHTQEGTLARSLLSQAIDEVDVDARHIVELLDGIPGAFERAQLGLDQAAAVEDLERLIFTHTLPADTRARVKRSIAPLEQFPLLGAALGGRWEGFRFVLGPW